jgi:hypothetical protein
MNHMFNQFFRGGNGEEAGWGVRTAALAAALKHPPPDGGVWTGPKAAAWMAATRGHRVHPPRGWEIWPRLGWTSKGPRPPHANAAPTAHAAFKKPFRP